MTDIDRYFLLNQEEKSLYLTKREAECVAYMAEGATAKQIAKTLDISFRTVESHIQQVKEKLNCPNKDMLIKSLIESNIIDILTSAKRQHGNV